ncbi:DEAD/DEAH box helicase [Vulcanisaeta sp. JCM 16159]|uniref:DEAD/DEAH box helicase n=1 Tax=Vulcanisaeta sp. JCM 16159 TaxID=1295371 RepID=UPI000A613331|nr:DEAD/DEAH box helicase [Vulcanisaeta sp. JCM 16159]
MSNFWSRYLHPRLVNTIKEFGYLEPTPVQERAIPRVLGGANVLITAPTGSGKTEAAMFPIMSKILSGGSTGGVAAIYITPARALNRDVNVRLREIANRLGITTAVRHGDTPESERRRQVREPPTILITTPETLQVILVMRSMRRALRNVRWVVVDELHELMNDERGAQLSIALERLVNIAGEYQRIGLSATIGNTELASQFLAGVGRRVEVVSVDVSREMEISVEYPEASEEDVGLAEELNTMPETAARLRRIAEIVGAHRATLVFTNTRDEAELLGHRLGRVFSDNAVGVYHGSLDKEEREGLEEGLRSGRVRTVVTTSSLELGIDIGHVDAVIQYSSPRQVAKLIQRVGRSGHRLGRRAVGYVIARDTDDYLESLVIARKALNNELEREVEYHEKALDVLHHQVAGMVIEAKIEGRALTVGDILGTVRRAHPYRELTPEELMEVLRFMEGNKLVRVNEDGTITPRRGLHRYYFESISMIPDQKHYRARDMITNKAIGELDEEFVETTEPGTQIILAGRPWKIVSIDRGKGEVILEPLNQILNAVPTWIGEEIPVPTEVAQEVCRLREELINAIANGAGPATALAKYPTREIPNPLIEELRQQAGTEVTEFTNAVIIEWRGRDAVIHACLGTKGNQALALYLARHIGQRYRVAVTYVTDPYRVLITTPISIPPQAITETLNQSPDYVEGELREAIRGTRLYKYRFIHVARRFGVLPRESVDVNIERLATALRDTVVDREVIREILTEKVDSTPLRQLVSSVREGRITVRVVKVEQYTPIAQHIINQAGKYDTAIQGIPTTTILQLLKKRIEEREVTLLCLNCGWHTTTKVKYIPEQIKCPRCGMRQIAVLKYGEDPRRTYEIARKARRKQRLTREEQEKWQELTQTA